MKKAIKIDDDYINTSMIVSVERNEKEDLTYIYLKNGKEYFTSYPVDTIMLSIANVYSDDNKFVVDVKDTEEHINDII